MDKRLRCFWAGALLALASPTHGQSTDPLILTPDSPWNVDYADDSCRLARTFISGTDKAVFVVDKFAPGAGFNLLVAGPQFKGFAGRRARIRFGPAGAEEVIDPVFDASFGNYGPAIMTGLSLHPAPATPGENLKALTKSDSSPVPDSEAGEPTPVQERAITWLEVQRGSRERPIRMALGPMHEAMAALRSCVDDLVAGWGIDVAAHRSLRQRPVPKSNPGNWAARIRYPSDLLQNGAQGVVRFRLMIDEAGLVSSCHIQQSTRPLGFDEAVCDALNNSRVRFEPALDAAGRPVKSYWLSSVRFQSGG